MPTLDKIIGIGKHSLVDYILNNNIYVPRMEYTTNVGRWSYVTSIAGILIYYGIGGILFFVIFVVKQLKKNSFLVREFVLILTVMSFGQTMLFNVYFVMYYTILFLLDTEKNSNKIKVILGRE